MAAMVTQGPEAARDVCSLFDLNKKALYTLVTKRDSKVRISQCPACPQFPSLGLYTCQRPLSRAAAFPHPASKRGLYRA